jgi:2'-5' RNA ligase
MRAFIAIDLPSNIKGEISKIQDKLKTNLARVNWIKAQNLHLTLKFLGQISPEQLDAVTRIITEISQTTVTFKIRLDDLGVFPNLHDARIIWVGIKQDTQLKQIVRLLETKIADMGIAKEKRDFSAHISIGRIKSGKVLKPSDLEKELNKEKNDVISANLEFDTGGITLFKSTQGLGGPIYTVLKEANFRIT